jgi:putative transposase
LLELQDMGILGTVTLLACCRKCSDTCGHDTNRPSAKRTCISYAGHRFPPDVISYSVWLYYRFPLSLRMIEELLAARGIELTYETVRRWSVKFGLGIARRIRSTARARGDKWHLDEVVVTINGKKHWLWRAVDQHGAVLDVLVQSRRDRHAARRLMRKLLKRHGRAPRVLITDKLKSYAAGNRDLGLNMEHRQHKGLNNRAENSHQPTRVREKVMRRFKSARHLQRFASVHDQVANLFMHCRYNTNAQEKRQARKQAFEAWETVTGNPMLDRLAA